MINYTKENFCISSDVKEALKEKAINFTKGLIFNKISRDIRQHGRIRMLFVVDQDEN